MARLTCAKGIFGLFCCPVGLMCCRYSVLVDKKLQLRYAGLSCGSVVCFLVVCNTAGALIAIASLASDVRT